MGKRDGYTARKLVDMLKFKCGLRDKYINDVQISDNFSFVSVPFRDAEEVVRKLNRLNRGRRPMAEIARDGENGRRKPRFASPAAQNRGLPGRRADIRPGTEKADAEREAGNARPGNPDGVRPGARPRRNGTRRTLTRPNGI